MEYNNLNKIYKTDFLDLYHCDCMELLRQTPDNYYSLALVDPPYRDENQPTKEMRNKIGGKMKDFGKKPNSDYFRELFRISKNQIVWGANNFIENLYSTNCWLFWYKNNPMKNYSDGEFAWTSFSSVSKCIPIEHYGSNTRDKDKIHPTQKPVDLYDWILNHYAQKDFKVLDTHFGSGSIALAVDKANRLDKMNLHLTACEIDLDYCNSAIKRIKESLKQRMLDF